MRVKLQVNYTAFGLKIAGISSKKLGDANEGALKNNRGYQADYSEFDDEVGWNEFALRNYDPQIGRWIQVDPYDEFPSPYTGMGNNPISFVDPTGGFLGLSPLASVAVSTLSGAIVGTAVDIISGGDGTKGLAIGAGVGLLGGIGANINWGTVSVGSITSAGLSAGNAALQMVNSAPKPASMGNAPVPVQSNPYAIPAANNTPQNPIAIVGIHSNSPVNDNTDWDYGHAWVSVSDLKGKLQFTLGLWKDEYVHGGNDDPNHTKSDVRMNEEIKYPYMSKPNYSYYKYVNYQGLNALHQFSKINIQFGVFTCTNWATNAFGMATDVWLNPFNAIGIPTPKALSRSLKSIGVNTVLKPAW